ncbi:hypothetical protein MHTCC0001_35650 [Flavobacteriaceae bacterium MHTCC 0001]
MWSCIWVINAQRDWDGIPVPASAGNGMEWQLQEAPSDDFNYTFNPTSNDADFGPPGEAAKWNNFFHNAWTGPGATLWRRDHVAVSGGNLNVWASRVTGNTKSFTASDGSTISRPETRAGCITSKTTVQYPVFVEARLRVMNSTLATDIWLLSPDDTQEVDIIECYGGTGDDNRNAFFSERVHLSHHVFTRNPFRDYQPADFNSWYRQDGVDKWGGRTIRIGVNMPNSRRIEYYIDGQLVRILDDDGIQSRLKDGSWEYTYPQGITGTGLDATIIRENGYQAVNTATSLQNAKDLSTTSVIDPINYLNNGRQINKALDIIINVEDQSWQAEANRSPNDTEIARFDDNLMLVDWIRVYKPVSSGGGSSPSVSFASPNNNATFAVGADVPVVVNASDNGSISNVKLYLNNALVRQENFAPYEWGLSSQNDTALENMAAGTYTLRAVAEDNDGQTAETSIQITVGNGGNVAVTGVTVTPSTLNLDVGDTGNLTGAVVPSNATDKTMTFVSSNTSVATVTQSGVVTAVASGTATITLTTTDGGHTTTATVNVSGSGNAPSVSFASPSNNATFAVGADVSVVVNASDDGSISNVKLYLNGTLVRQENITPYEWGLSSQNDTALENMAAGTYTLRAVAEDNDGETSETSIQITVGSGGSCDVPFTSAGTTVSNETETWSTGSIDISCATSVNISLQASGVGPMENADYLNVYYRVNGGSNVTILENVNTYSAQTLTVNNINGNTLEIIVEGKTSTSDEIYTVNNISVSASGQTQKNIGAKTDEIQIKNEVDILFYPNPVNERLNVNITNELQANSQIILYNIQGSKVLQQPIRSNNESIEMSNLPSGIYVIKVLSAKDVIKRQMIVKN